VTQSLPGLERRVMFEHARQAQIALRGLVRVRLHRHSRPHLRAGRGRAAVFGHRAAAADTAGLVNPGELHRVYHVAPRRGPAVQRRSYSAIRSAAGQASVASPLHRLSHHISDVPLDASRVVATAGYLPLLTAPRSAAATAEEGDAQAPLPCGPQSFFWQTAFGDRNVIGRELQVGLGLRSLASPRGLPAV
jgi:hypothetical protein